MGVKLYDVTKCGRTWLHDFNRMKVVAKPSERGITMRAHTVTKTDTLELAISNQNITCFNGKGKHREETCIPGSSTECSQRKKKKERKKEKNIFYIAPHITIFTTPHMLCVAQPRKKVPAQHCAACASEHTALIFSWHLVPEDSSIKEILDLPMHTFKKCVKTHLVQRGYYTFDEFLNDKVEWKQPASLSSPAR
ncbi:jg23819 [Pararge aegeria aegeria]|uniref:Jg23819 protein n=1 Tax=Pararge aegeria aegeria TaxID=348720 RepID=A0A8S4SH51_9NEOP|nr:jg23819 [Pararge aegeria aegeria]